MDKRNLNRIWFIAGLFILSCFRALGDEEHFYNSISGANFAPDSLVMVKDDKFETTLWSTICQNLSVTDVVTLQFNEDTNLFLSAPHTCTVDLEVYFYNELGVEDSVTKSLTISYDTTRGKAFNFRSSFKFKGMYEIGARIIDVIYDHTMTTSYPAVFTLSTDIFINRIYCFNCSKVDDPYHTYDNVNQRLNIYWTPFPGADEYDLEWTFYDNLSYLVTNELPSLSSTYSDFDYLFIQ